VLKESILKFLKLDSLIANLSGYIEARVELLKVEIREDIARAVARTLVFVILAFVATLFIFFISIAVAYKLGEHIGVFGGFAIVAGFYALIGIILWVTRNAASQKLEQQLKEIMKQTKK
jgi:uncharacterized membrane protein YqjE